MPTVTIDEVHYPKAMPIQGEKKTMTPKTNQNQEEDQLRMKKFNEVYGYEVWTYDIQTIISYHSDVALKAIKTIS